MRKHFADATGSILMATFYFTRTILITHSIYTVIFKSRVMNVRVFCLCILWDFNGMDCSRILQSSRINYSLVVDFATYTQQSSNSCLTNYRCN